MDSHVALSIYHGIIDLSLACHLLQEPSLLVLIQVHQVYTTGPVIDPTLTFGVLGIQSECPE